MAGLQRASMDTSFSLSMPAYAFEVRVRLV